MLLLHLVHVGFQRVIQPDEAASANARLRPARFAGWPDADILEFDFIHFDASKFQKIADETGGEAAFPA